MDVRKLIKEEVRKAVLNEGAGFIPVPRTFDHLKWEFSPNQKHYLQRMCQADLDSISESEYKDASRFLGIPEKNVKSIINTYQMDDPIREATHGRESVSSRNSALTMGNKPATAKDIGLSVDDSRLPDFEYPMGRQMHTNPPGMSHLEAKTSIEADALNRTWYREGEGKEHVSKSRERFYESLNNSLMMYLFCESHPKDINLRSDNKIQLDFEPIIEEGKFNQLGSTSYENDKYRMVIGLLEYFNNKFGCSYVISNHVGLDDCQRMFIEHNVTEQVDMSEDSMKMMKKYLLTKVITGHKLEKENAELAGLMGLDAGDTSWLYGPLGQAPQSEIIASR